MSFCLFVDLYTFKTIKLTIEQFTVIIQEKLEVTSMSEFSGRFKLLKYESGITLKELSKELDISVPNLSYYMKGREPSYDILIKIADYYNVTTDWLLGRTDERNTAQSSVIEEIEKQLGLDDTEKLSGDNRRLFLKDQYTLYDAMVNIYRFFLLCENNHSIILTHNVYLLMLCSIIEYHMDEFNKVICNISKETILNLMRKEELIADVARSTILLSSYTYADGLAHEQSLTEKEQTALQELTKYTLSKYKEKNSDTFELFLKMTLIKDNDLQ